MYPAFVDAARIELWREKKKKADNVVIGAELNISVYYTGGFFMSFGCDWTMNRLEFKKQFFLMNSQTLHLFFPTGTSSYLNSVCFILSAGYAFSHKAIVLKVWE